MKGIKQKIRNKVRKFARRPIIKTLRICFVGFVWACTIGCVLLAYYIHDLPDTDKLTKSTGEYQIRIMSADGELITTMGNLYGHEMNLRDIPPYLIQAVLATEDRRFYEHFGFDIYGFSRAMMANMAAGRVVQGGSTITQQLAKIVFLSPERTFKRKVQELLLAFWLEYKFSKDQILAMYLNRVYMGAGYFGVDAAARGYFGKATEDLSLNEAAMLAGLLKAPSRYSPFSDKEVARKRATQVLVNMVDAGYLSVSSAVNVGNALNTRPRVSNSRFYFIDWLTSEIPSYVGIIDSNLTVVTTLDLRLQKIAEETVKKVMADGEARNASQAALLAMSPRGEVLAMVGGKDYGVSQFNRVTQAQRQPGSSFKLAVYLAAFNAGYTPKDVFTDQEITIDDRPSNTQWTPKNWDNIYRGDMTLKYAFANSVNSVAVQLCERVGKDRVASMAQTLGIKSPMLPIPSMALGTNEVSLLEMVQAYAHLPNEGYMVRAYGIKEITREDGSYVYKHWNNDDIQAIPKEVVAKMNILTKAVMEEGTGRRTRLDDRESAGKSGTTQDFRDAWFIGYTPQIVAGVWVGNDDNRPMDGVTGNSLSGQIWNEFMTRTMSKMPKLSIPTSVGLFSWLGREWEGPGADEEGARRTFWDSIMNSLEVEEEQTESEYLPADTDAAPAETQ